MIFAMLTVFASFLAYFTDVQKQEYVYKKVGDIAIDLNVYQPTYNIFVENNLASPILFAIHGGGFVFGEKDTALTYREIQEFASRGWTVVAINYRLAPPSFLPDIVSDMQEAYKFVREKLPGISRIPVDTDLICIFGRSAGGGLALMAAKHLKPHFPCIIALYPYGASLLDSGFYDPTTSPSEELVAAVKRLKEIAPEFERSESPDDDRNVVFRLSIQEKKGGWLLISHDPKVDPKKVQDRLKAFSPLENIDKKYPPTYIAHGTKDSVVPYEQSIKMKEALEKYNRTVVIDTSFDEGHVYDLRSVERLFDGESIWKNHVIPAFDWAAIQIQNYKKEKRN